RVWLGNSHNHSRTVHLVGPRRQSGRAEPGRAAVRRDGLGGRVAGVVPVPHIAVGCAGCNVGHGNPILCARQERDAGERGEGNRRIVIAERTESAGMTAKDASTEPGEPEPESAVRLTCNVSVLVMENLLRAISSEVKVYVAEGVKVSPSA